MTDDACRFIVFDFDNHEKGAEKKDFSNADDLWRDEVDSLRKICDINGIDALVERSRSGRGAHLWIFFQKPIEAGLARKFGNALLNIGAESVNLKSFRFYDRMLPMQDHLSEGGVGNLIALPLQGQALKEGNSAFAEFMLGMIRNALKEISETHNRTNVAINVGINVVTNEEKNNCPFKAGWQYVS